MINSEPLMDKNYLHYLSDARSVISASVQACRAWSAPYDGLNPVPGEYLGEEECDDREEQKEKDERDPSLDAPPTQPPTPQPPSETSSTTERERGGTLLELEWDDSYDAAPDTEDNQQNSENSHISERPIANEPPKHIQEMRKNAIMLIRGSYIEESDFQDDVLVYSLIAQKDAKDDCRASLKTTRSQNHIRSHSHVQTEPNNNTYLHMYSSTQNHIHNNIQKHMHNNIMNHTHNNLEDYLESSNITKGLGSCLETSNNRKNKESEEALKLLNGHLAEEQMKGLDNKTASQEQDSTKVQEQDFISQCLQIIRTLGGNEESELDDEADFQRLTGLLHDEEGEVDFSSFCNDDCEHEGEGSEGSEQKESEERKHGVPFTGELAFKNML